MYKIRTILPAILLLSFLAVSCELINPPEDIPAYIRIDTISFKVTQFDQGAATHQISNIWLTVDNELLGIFEMPFKVPCLKTGEQEIFIRPGIRVNGIAASRMVYPFLEPYRVTMNLVQGEVVTILPSTTYKKECVFSWIEEFEDIGISFNYSQYTDVTFTIQSQTVRSGIYSGAVFLTKRTAFSRQPVQRILSCPGTACPLFLNSITPIRSDSWLGPIFLKTGPGFGMIWFSSKAIRSGKGFISTWNRQ